MSDELGPIDGERRHAKSKRRMWRRYLSRPWVLRLAFALAPIIAAVLRFFEAIIESTRK